MKTIKQQWDRVWPVKACCLGGVVQEGPSEKVTFELRSAWKEGTRANRFHHRQGPEQSA